MRSIFFTFPLFLAFWAFVAPLSLAGENWPQFRGPGGQGHADATGMPLRWSETENIVWKTALPGRGWSSPVVWGNQVWMTTAIEQEPSAEYRQQVISAAPNPRGLEVAGSVTMYALCVELDSGKLLHNIELFHSDAPEPINALNSYASPTPSIQAGRVYCHFGTYGTACLDTNTGRILWKNQSLRLDHQNGPGHSPVVWGDLLIVHCDGLDVQYIAALNKHHGQLVWRTDRSGRMSDNPPYRKAYASPLVTGEGGRQQVISAASDWVYSYDPSSGKELWRVNYGKLGFSNVARPVAGHGMVYICTCFPTSTLMAIRCDGMGDVSDTHVVWRQDSQMPKLPSPLLVGRELYVVSDNGIATCLDALVGETHWRQRLGGNHSASPLLADGRIYFFSREGDAVVISPGREFQQLALNRLQGQFMASAAVAGSALLLRSDRHLYRIEAVGAAGR